MNICWLVPATTHGYAKASGELAHRVAYEIAHGPIPEGLHVLHTCDVRNCVNPDHLFAGSQYENMIDMVLKGRSGSMKLSFEQVKAIRGDKRLQWQIANDYGITQVTVSRVKAGKVYGYVK